MFSLRKVTASRETETLLFVVSSTLTLWRDGLEATLVVPVTRLLAALFRVEMIMIMLPLVPWAPTMTCVMPKTWLWLPIEELLNPRMTKFTGASLFSPSH